MPVQLVSAQDLETNNKLTWTCHLSAMEGLSKSLALGPNSTH